MHERSPPKGKPFPIHETDEDAERFVDEVDLSEYDFSGFRPMRLEFATRELTVRLPVALVETLERAAKRRGISLDDLVHEAMREVAMAEAAERTPRADAAE